jgi:hypothetical protein
MKSGRIGNFDFDLGFLEDFEKYRRNPMLSSEEQKETSSLR